MKRNEQDFIEEITENFSELLVEAFYIRYIREFPKEKMVETINLTKEVLEKKINEKFNKKLKRLHIKY